MEKRYIPKTIRGKVSNTGLPIDGCVLTLTSWNYDDHSSYHLYNWEEKNDEAVMRTMHQEDDLYKDMLLDDFEKVWKGGYEPDGSYCIPLDKVEVVEVLCEEHEVEVKEISSIDYYFRISERANMAHDEDGNPCECYMKLGLKLKQPIRENRLEHTKEKCTEDALAGVAKFLKIDISNLTSITEQDYLDNTDED